MLHGIDEQFAVEDVDVEVVSAVGCEVSVHEVDEVVNLCVALLAECGRRDGEGVGDAVVAVLEWQFGY